MFCLVGKLAMKFIQDNNINYWPTPAESLDMNSIETINYEVAIIWRFKSICFHFSKKAPDHWSLVILIAQSVSCPLLSQNRVFTIVSNSEVVSTPSRSLNLKQFKKHVKSCDCLSSGVSNYLTCVRYNIPFMQITICVVLVCVYCSDFLCSKYASHLSKFISYVSFQLPASSIKKVSHFSTKFDWFDNQTHKIVVWWCSTSELSQTDWVWYIT